MRSIALALIIALVISLVPISLSADRSTGGIVLSANPSSVVADGKSFTTITAEVRDKDGKFAPDGTEVHFTASMGEIEEVGTVQSGAARVKLTSANIPGVSVVTATWVDGQAVARIDVAFGQGAMPTGPDYIDVKSDGYLAYSVDHQVVEAIGVVKLKYRALELEAHSVQVDLGKMKIIAKGGGPAQPVKLISKSGNTEASIFTCDFSASQGLLLSAERGKVQQVSITSSGWTLGTDNAVYMPDQFDFTDLSDSGIVVKAKQATVFPGEKIQFRRTSVFVDGKRMLSLPLYVLSLTGYQADGEQYLGYSTGGLSLNLPFYYALSPQSSGSMLLRYGESTGFSEFSQTPGWYIDLKQRYRTEKSEGMLTLSHITDRWGAQFSHSQRFGQDASAYLFLDSPTHESLYGSTNLNKSFKNLDMGLNLSGSTYPKTGEQTFSGDIHLQTHPKAFGKLPLKYTIAARADESSASSTLGTTTATSRSVTQRLDGNLYTNPLFLTKKVSLRCSSALGYVFGDPDLSGLSVLGNAVMDWKISNRNNLQLSYRYTSKPSYRLIDPDPTDDLHTYIRVRDRDGSQAVSASLRLGDGKRWTGNVFALKGLNYSSENVFADLSYRISPDLRFSVRSTLNRYAYMKQVFVPNPTDPTAPGKFVLQPASQSFDDLELSFGKSFGSREVDVVWSKHDGRIMLQLGSAGF